MAKKSKSAFPEPEETAKKKSGENPDASSGGKYGKEFRAERRKKRQAEAEGK